MAKFNGHKNWNHWNVSLWINNDEGLYRLVLANINAARFSGHTRDFAAKVAMQTLKADGITHTPDGAPYSATTIRAAMRGM
jgi:hypothetical protein